MIKYKEQQITQLTPEEVTCNACNQVTTNEYISVEHNFGYWSKHDGETHSFELCESCFFKITSTFKIPPKVIGYDD